MTDLTAKDALAAIPAKYAQPPDDLIAKIPKGGISISYVGHGDITLMLIEVDPMWTWEPLAFSEKGSPLITGTDKRLVMWGRMTVHGITRVCVGTCEANKSEPEKELIGDLIRNGAMRFGIGTKLWSKTAGVPGAESGESFDNARPATSQPATRPPRATNQTSPSPAAPTSPSSTGQPPTTTPADPGRNDPPPQVGPRYNADIYAVLDSLTPPMLQMVRQWFIQNGINLTKAELEGDELNKVIAYLEVVTSEEQPGDAEMFPPGQEPF